MVKQDILAWMQPITFIALIMLIILIAITFSWFGEPQYIQAAVIFTLIGVVGTALSLSCHDRLDNPRLVFYLIVMASGALFIALPFV